jgi:hypothetical protein
MPPTVVYELAVRIKVVNDNFASVIMEVLLLVTVL